MGPPGGHQKPSKRGGDGGGGSGGDHRLHHQHRGEEDDGSSSVRNLVRTIREELLVLHREQQQHQQKGGGGANASDENNSERRTKSALEKLVETHFRGGVFGGTSSSFFLCSSSFLRSSMCFVSLSLSLSLLFSKILTFATSKTSLFLFRPRNVLRVSDDVFIFWRSRRVVNSGSTPSVARCDTKTAKLVQTRRHVFVGGDGVFARVSFDVRSIVFFGYEKGSVGVGVQIDAIHCRGR